MTGNAVDLTDKDFHETVNRPDVPVPVYFWASWCGEYAMMAPVTQEIADGFGDRVRICKLNTDDGRDTALEFSMSSVPTIILFKKRQIRKKKAEVQKWKTANR